MRNATEKELARLLKLTNRAAQVAAEQQSFFAKLRASCEANPEMVLNAKTGEWCYRATAPGPLATAPQNGKAKGEPAQV